MRNGSLTYAFNVVVSAACAAAVATTSSNQVSDGSNVYYGIDSTVSAGITRDSDGGGSGNEDSGTTMLGVALDLVKLSYRVGSLPDAVTLNPLLRL